MVKMDHLMVEKITKIIKAAIWNKYNNKKYFFKGVQNSIDIQSL